MACMVVHLTLRLLVFDKTIEYKVDYLLYIRNVYKI
jgi:hypothetical protein